MQIITKECAKVHSLSYIYKEYMQYTDVIFERMCTDVIHCEMSRRYINVTCNVYQRNVSVGLAKEASSSCKETDTVPVAPFTLAILVPKDC